MTKQPLTAGGRGDFKPMKRDPRVPGGKGFPIRFIPTLLLNWWQSLTGTVLGFRIYISTIK